MLTETTAQDVLPHVTVRWDPGGTEVSVEGYDAALPEPTAGLVIRATRYRPGPFVLETTDQVICVLGSPILGERIDRQGVAEQYLLAQDKTSFLPSINGEFLIIHLDKTTRRLSLASDRFAAVPFYYVLSNGHLEGSVYYNDLWSDIRRYPGFRVNAEAVFEFMHLQRLLGTKTYDNLSRFLPSATLLIFDGQRVSLTQYWEPNFTKDERSSVRDLAVELIRRLNASIRRKTSDGLRYGLFLSGGMDTRTILAAFDPPPCCFTVGFSENYEVRVAREVARIKGASHRFILLPPDYYARHLDELVHLGGGMYVFDHALFFGLQEHVSPNADVVFHGHGMDYLFQGMYLPTRSYSVFSRQTYLRRLRPLGDDLVTEYLSTIKFRLKPVDLFRYVRPPHRQRVQASLRHAVEEIIEQGRRFCRTPFDVWEYLLIHALSRHYSNCNISDLVTSAEQRTLTFENDLFNFYLALPPEKRFAAQVMRCALRTMSPKLARFEMANTGLKIDSSPLEQQFHHTLRWMKHSLTRNRKYRHPTAADRTWPYRDTYLRQHPRLIQAIREASRSEALASVLPFLDMDTLSSDIDHWLTQPSGGGDLMATLVTIDRFLKQP